MWRCTPQMVAAASAWASAYTDNGTDPRWRKKLHTWISGENWDADPPLPYESPKAAAIANKRAGKAKAKAPAASRHAYPGSRSKAKAKPPAAGSRKPTTAVSKEGVTQEAIHRCTGRHQAGVWEREP